MKDRFRQWLNEGHDFLKDKLFNFNVTNNIQLVGWLFTLYSNFILFLEKNNIQMNDKIIRFALERYIEEALKKNWGVQDIKNNTIKIINSMNSNTSAFDMLFYVKGLEPHTECVSGNETKFKKL